MRAFGGDREEEKHKDQMRMKAGEMWVVGARVEGAIKPACPPCSFATFIVAFLICMQRDLDGAPVGLSVVSADSVLTNAHSTDAQTHTHTHHLVKARETVPQPNHGVIQLKHSPNQQD